jgi:dTDP-4-amino-4,6-dideoxygalactose transaminase
MIYKQLEQEYSEFVGSKFAVSCNSGTSALHLALMAIGVGPRDEVIVPDFTMVACGFAVAYTGAKVVTVDCGDDLNINPDLIESKITKKTKAIMAVHIYGRLCDMNKILKIAKKHKLKVIEDACEAQGAVYKSKADITCYSFYKNKIIHAEEGGICTTDNQDYAKRMNYLKNMAFGDSHNYFHKEIGYNYRLADSQAELALESLRDYPENNKLRRLWEYKLNELVPTDKRDAVWVYNFEMTNEFTRDIQMDYLESIGYPVRYYFKPLSTMPMFKQEVGPKALIASQRGLYICYPR